CVAGEFEVFENLDETYRAGLFAKPARYPARVRFANAASTIVPDYEPDVRAVSMSLDLGNSQKQDFAMNNDPVFPIGNLRDFNFLLDVGFAKAAAVGEAIAAGSTLEEAEAAGE